MTTAQTTQAVIWYEQLAAAAIDQAARLREQLTATADTQYRVEGVAPSWRMPDVATVSTSLDRDKVAVTDPAALLRWAAERHPEQVQQSVRTAFIEHLRKTGRPAGTDVVDAQGEIVPGLTYIPGGRFRGISIKPTETGAAVFRALAETSLQLAESAAGPALGVQLAELLAAETPGELTPDEVGE